jgi:urease accessory protein
MATIMTTMNMIIPVTIITIITANATPMAACLAIRTMATTMADPKGNLALLRLMTWLSPAFPTGGFAYSHGLERAAHDGLLPDTAALEHWLADLIAFGSGWNDAVLFAEAHRRAQAGAGLHELAELAEALAGSEERHRETTLQGSAFTAAAAGWPREIAGGLPENCPYCIAVGATAGVHGVPLRDALAAFLQAFAANLVQASIRLGVTGQTGAVETIAALEPLVLAVAARAEKSTLDDLGSATFLSDIMAMKHETQHSRLFRS